MHGFSSEMLNLGKNEQFGEGPENYKLQAI